MAPPLPPPGVPWADGLPPQPIARLYLSTLLSTSQETPMLLSAQPLEHTPPRNVSREMYTGRFRYSLRARMAAPPRSGPVESQRLLKNLELTTLSWPPRAKMAPPPPPS